MPTLLVQHAELLITMDAKRRRISDGALFVRNNVIDQVGPTADLPDTADTVINARGMVILPGLVNTHHHLYQTLTRVTPGAQNAGLFDWLTVHYPIWAELTAEGVYVSALVGLSELMLSGCTTASDHLYLYPNDCKIDHEIQAARELGIRFHASRGSMSLGRSKGGLPPDRVVEDEDAILTDTRRAIETFHDPNRYAMIRIVVAPCSPFSVTPELMRKSVELARGMGVRCHTHLAETQDEEQFCLKQFGKRPFQYASDLGWTGKDVWYAHSVHAKQDDIALLARTGTGVAHCPTSNMRLGSGIAPVVSYLKAGVPVGLGVDGSASNDSNQLLNEMRQAMLLQRVQNGPGAMGAEQALEIATLGGAKVLGREDIGALAPGMAADFIGYNLDTVDFAGARHDPLAALVFCTPQRVSLSVINGKVRVQEGKLVGFDLAPIVARHNVISKKMLEKTR